MNLLFRKMLFVLFIIIISAKNLACFDHKEDFFLEYGRLSCLVKVTLAKRDSLSQILSVTDAELAAAKAEAARKLNSYEYEIHSLENKMSQVKTSYEQKYIMISQRHERRYGHMITPKYEQDINNLEKWKEKEVKPLEQRVTMLNRQIDEDSDLKNLKRIIDSLQEVLGNQLKHLRGYEKELNEARIQIQDIDADLDEELKQSPDKGKFMVQRKKLQLSPCK